MVVKSSRGRRAAVRHLVVAVVAGLSLVAGVITATGVSADTESVAPPVPRADCGPGSLPETDIQGRVPKADYGSGRAAQGYTCNAAQVAHQGTSGGFKVLRYTDDQGNVCAFYDSTTMIGVDVASNLLNGTGLGVVVLDMNDPAHPVKTANLVTPAMLSPHESLLVNEKRGILAAVMGTALTAPGVLDLYDVKTDCRHPRLLSTTPSAILGHESGFSPDGNTFYSSGVAGLLTAVDVSNPRLPRPIATMSGVVYHGLRLSDDGRTMYVANIGTWGATGLSGAGLVVLDTSEIQDRAPSPKFHILSSLTWHGVSIPQVAQPFTRNGHHYLLEVDEFTDLFSASGITDMRHAPVGAARIIDIEDPLHPSVVSDIRLEVHQPEAHAGEQWGDPGANVPVQGYAAHYCSVPTPTDPDIAGCSMILSGLRLFDIRDVEHPKEVAYFNKPRTSISGLSLTAYLRGGFAMSQPAWDPAHDSVWYTDGGTGFYVVRLTNGVQDLLPPA